MSSLWQPHTKPNLSNVITDLNIKLGRLTSHTLVRVKETLFLPDVKHDDCNQKHQQVTAAPKRSALLKESRFQKNSRITSKFAMRTHPKQADLFVVWKQINLLHMFLHAMEPKVTNNRQITVIPSFVGFAESVYERLCILRSRLRCHPFPFIYLQ